MYTDRDRSGRLSIMEIGGAEEEALLGALTIAWKYYDGCRRILGDSDGLREMCELTAAAVRKIKSV